MRLAARNAKKLFMTTIVRISSFSAEVTYRQPTVSDYRTLSANIPTVDAQLAA
jgi:hypothetical protein